MLRRTLTALCLAPPVVYLIGWAPRWLFLAALLITVELGLHEFFALSRQAGFKTFPVIGYIGGGALCLAPAADLHALGTSIFSVLLFLVLCTLSLVLRTESSLKDHLGASATTIFGAIYVGLLLSCLVPLRFSEPPLGGRWFVQGGVPEADTGRKTLLLLFLVLWAGDIFAFLVGRTLGRRPFFPRLSPQKTLEGAVGGLIGSLLLAWAFSHWFWQTANQKTVILLGGVLGLSGQVGDLVESALKRGANVKDSGALLPGHGGLLDRIDSLLFGAPTLWLVLTLKEFWPW